MMKRITNVLSRVWSLWQRVPLRARVFLNIVLILGIITFPAYLLYAEAVTKPTDYFSHFRIEEQRRLIGPSNIIHTIEWNDRNDNKLIIAEDQDAWIIYNYSSLYKYNNKFQYLLKDEYKGVIASPVFSIQEDGDRKALFILFDDDPNAVKAKLTVHEKFPQWDNDRYTLSFITEIKENGMFLFIRDVNYDIKSTSYQAYASVSNLLSGISDNTYGIAEIELYDQNDILLQKKTITIRKT